MWFAHRIQRPAEKINHAIYSSVRPDGKDTLIEPLKHGVGPWNFAEVTPLHIMGRFNDYLKSTVLRISEGRDLGEVSRYALYDHLKQIIASPPDVFRIDEKNIREYSVPDCVGVIITSNYDTDGMYLPADDRRSYVAGTDVVEELGQLLRPLAVLPRRRERPRRRLPRRPRHLALRPEGAAAADRGLPRDRRRERAGRGRHPQGRVRGAQGEGRERTGHRGSRTSSPST